MKNPQTIRTSAKGIKLFSTVNIDGTKIIEKRMNELQAQAWNEHDIIDAKKARQIKAAEREAYVAELNDIFEKNGIIDGETASWLQNGFNIDKDRKKWQQVAMEHAVPSKSEFTVYRVAQDKHDGVSSWTVDKRFTEERRDAHLYDYDKGMTNMYTKTVHVGDMVTFVGNQNGLNQFEVIL